MARGLPEANLGVVQVRPQARVSDGYVAPQARTESLGIQLARSLAPLSQGLRAHFQQQQEQADDATRARARKDALSQAQTEIDAVQKGEMFAAESTIYQKAYREQRGLLEGQRIRTEALQSYQDQGLENSTDTAEFDQFLSGFMKDKLEGITDPDMLRGALGVVEQAANNMSLQNAARVSENLENGILDDATTLIGNAMQAETEAALREKRDFDVNAVMQVVNASNARTKFLQLPGPALRKRITDLVVDRAVLDADPTVLKLLDQQMDVNGKKVPLADGYWKAKRDEVQMRVQSRQIQISDQLAQQQERDQKARLQTGQSALLGVFAQNPYAMPSSAQLAEWEAFAPGLAEQALTIRNKLIEAREKSSPGATLAAMADYAQDPANLGKLFDAVRSGTVDASMLRWGLTTFERASKLGEGDPNAGWRNVRSNPALVGYFARFDEAATDPILGNLYENAPQEIARAKGQFNIAVLEYASSHPEATLMETMEYADKVFERLTKVARDMAPRERPAEQQQQAPAARPSRPSSTPAMPAAEQRSVFDAIDPEE